MKRLILLGVTFALFISCLFFNPTSNSPLKAGAGMGTDEKIETFEDLIPVLNLLNDKASLENSSLFTAFTNLLSNSDSVDLKIGENSSKATQKHESATLTLRTSVSTSMQSSNHKYSNGVTSTSQKLNREMTMYITEDATLYDSKGFLTQNKYYIVEKEVINGTSSLPSIEGTGEATVYHKDTVEESKQDTLSLYFDMQVLSIDGKSYVNIKELSFNDTNRSLKIKQKNVNKWIKMPYEFVDDIVDIDYENRMVLSSIGELINYLIEADEIDADEKNINIDENDLKAIIEELEGKPTNMLDDSTLNLKIDLTSPTSPYINSVATTNSTNTTENVTITTKSNVSQEIIINNIDNTVISFDNDKVDIKVKTEKDFEKLFIIEEREENDD